MSGITSPPPFIKDEPDEFHFSPGPHYMNSFSQHLDNQNLNSWAGSGDAVDTQTSGGMPRTFSSNNMSSSYIAGNSGVTDDDLMASLDLVDQGNAPNSHNAIHAQAHLPTPQSFSNGAHNSMQMQNRQQNFQQTYSSTPDGQPISSPFVNGFDFSQWQPVRSMNQMQATAQPSRPSFDKRTSSVSKSPMTPGVGHLQIGTPDSGSFPSQAVPVGHRKSSSQQWDSSIGSGYSYIDSPLASPNNPNAQHPQISEVLNKGSSLPVSAMSAAGHGKTRPSVEDKKARRRASHNEVERKRRNNINNQITTLSRLVPPHRLEDDNIRRALNSNTSLPASITGGATGSGMSPPPQATSLLAGGTGRRATGGITQGLPLDEKDKAPAKGDVLNSSVGWTRDLMWLLNRLMHRESVMQETIESLGGQVPIQISDEENRMRTELLECLQRNAVDSFEYSRRHGSNLWVPGHTDPAGVPVPNDGSDTSNAAVNAMVAMMPNNNGTDAGSLENTLWGYPSNDAMDGPSPLEFKEEDEYINMDI